MAIQRPYASLLTSKKGRDRRRKALEEAKKRLLQLEKLEDRMLLTTGPQLIGIQPTDGSLIQPSEANIRNVAPVDLTFRFNENAAIDGIRSGSNARKNTLQMQELYYD